MIIHLKKETNPLQVEAVRKQLKALAFEQNGRTILVNSSKQKTIPSRVQPFVERSFVLDTDVQLASRKYQAQTRSIQIGDVTIGGDTNNTMVITGPCSVESEEQIFECAELCKQNNIKILRAGCYKPRTSPYSFQGLGLEGLKLLDKVRDKKGLRIITEVKDASQIQEVIQYSDIIQVGAKAMYDQGILRKCSQTKNPVLLKRGFGTTLQEFLQAAEFILSGGNPNVMLCERGIRTFETKTRFTLDLCGVAFLKEHTNLPIVLDPSHALGYRYGIADLSRACVAMGIDGLLIETHPCPERALSDATQQLNFEEFTLMYQSLVPVAKAVGKTIV